MQRNRCKRVVREAFRLDPSFLPQGVDLLVIAKEGAPTLGLEDVRREWTRARNALLQRVHDVLSAATTVKS